jgi:Domain of unknown function (DUF4440)
MYEQGLCIVFISVGDIFALCLLDNFGKSHSEPRGNFTMDVDQERAWAEMACGGKWIANDVFADDFNGTSPNGGHYGKPTGSPTYDPNTKWSTDCKLDEADVRFFSSQSAVVFGKESKTVPLTDGKQERRCLVWTDTWIRRNGKWQMIAVQDGRIDCPRR